MEVNALLIAKEKEPALANSLSLPNSSSNLPEPSVQWNGMRCQSRPSFRPLPRPGDLLRHQFGQWHKFRQNLRHIQISRLPGRGQMPGTRHRQTHSRSRCPSILPPPELIAPDRSPRDCGHICGFEFPRSLPFPTDGQIHKHQLVESALPQHLGWELGHVIGGGDNEHWTFLLLASRR